MGSEIQNLNVGIIWRKKVYPIQEQRTFHIVNKWIFHNWTHFKNEKQNRNHVKSLHINETHTIQTYILVVLKLEKKKHEQPLSNSNVFILLCEILNTYVSVFVLFFTNGRTWIFFNAHFYDCISSVIGACCGNVLDAPNALVSYAILGRLMYCTIYFTFELIANRSFLGIRSEYEFHFDLLESLMKEKINTKAATSVYMLYTNEFWQKCAKWGKNYFYIVNTHIQYIGLGGREEWIMMKIVQL